METKLKRPGGEIANRPLHFFWVVDCSGSMAGDKIDAVNHAIQETIQPMKDAADNNPNAQLYVRTLKFATGASWVTADPVRIEDFEWVDLSIDDYAVTDMGKAFEMVAAQLEMPPMPSRSLPPVIVLLSDGYPTDDWKRPLEKLLKMPWGKKAVKIAIAIGKNADSSVLEAFTENSEQVFAASNPEMLVHLIKWASTIASTVSAPTTRPDEKKSEPEAENGGEDPDEELVDAPAPDPYNLTPPDIDNISREDVW